MNENNEGRKSRNNLESKERWTRSIKQRTIDREHEFVFCLHKSNSFCFRCVNSDEVGKGCITFKQANKQKKTLFKIQAKSSCLQYECVCTESSVNNKIKKLNHR